MRRLLFVAFVVLITGFTNPAESTEQINLKQIAVQMASGANAHNLAEALGMIRENHADGYEVSPADKQFSSIFIARDDRGMVTAKSDKKQEDMLAEYAEFEVNPAIPLNFAEVKKIFPGEWKFLPPNPDEFLTIYGLEYDNGAKYKLSIFIKYAFEDKNGERVKSINLRVDPRQNSRW